MVKYQVTLNKMFSILVVFIVEDLILLKHNENNLYKWKFGASNVTQLVEGLIPLQKALTSIPISTKLLIMVHTYNKYNGKRRQKDGKFSSTMAAQGV